MLEAIGKVRRLDQLSTSRLKSPQRKKGRERRVRVGRHERQHSDKKDQRRKKRVRHGVDFYCNYVMQLGFVSANEIPFRKLGKIIVFDYLD